MDTAAFLDHLRHQPWYRDQVAHVQPIAPRAVRHAGLDRPLPAVLDAALEALGIRRLYIHQAQAVNALRSGENAIVCTPAASGKTLCYNLPVLETLLAEKGARALYLFPTKALAQDQLRALHSLTSAAELDIYAATYDGDTPSEERGEIRRNAQVLITNPDMLHMGILPNHRAWSRFLRHLRYVVVDEAHIYRGVFGSHVALVLRRLRRLCAHYGASPRFVLSSATIANPGEHAERLTGLPFRVIDDDGAPYGGKDFVFWNPPLVNEARGRRKSANSEASQLFTELVQTGTRTILFVRTRRLAELLYRYTRERLQETDKALAARVSPYRAGYTPEDRRRIEQALFRGDLLGVSATNALELGVDIGDLDATVLTGYPGSIASVWQQAGRSGRRGERSLSILVAVDNPLDQYFMRHPDAFFGKTCEHALTSPANPHIAQPHILCAAYELPLMEQDARYFGPGLAKRIEALVEKDLLHPRGEMWYLSAAVAYPAEGVNIRSTSSDPYTLVEEQSGSLLETVESAVAFFQVHPGAIYLHQGESYLITRLDI
ncbi:MAG: DEAD/DEAH box helicase, partial [Chloroflexi bacterium]|nr:DEAD/DEAH box helicase [Chloroflexota bacterium]